MKETKVVGMLDSLLNHFHSGDRSFNHYGQGHKETIGGKGKGPQEKTLG